MWGGEERKETEMHYKKGGAHGRVKGKGKREPWYIAGILAKAICIVSR